MPPGSFRPSTDYSYLDHSRFLRHEPCPKCGSKDNLGVWDDGHKYCFGCGYVQREKDSLTSIAKQLEGNNNNENIPRDLHSDSFVSDIPGIAHSWLEKYGITPTEMQAYRLMWNTRTQSLVFPCFNPNGKLIFYQERYFGPNKDHPKYLTFGSPDIPFATINNTLYNSGGIVLVEDFVSSFKVGRYITSGALTGSKIAPKAFKWLSGRFKQARLWLDMDKAAESLVEASKLSGAIPDVRSIITHLDPKEYSNEVIFKTLIESGIIKNRKKP